ncbi:sensor histidine kinase [Virgisporangium ochraceum]|nr:GAF domain-containing sensor histidine kinase [Virgisporangium ochraceum]
MRWAYPLFALTMALSAVAVGGAVAVDLSWADAVDSYLVTNAAMGTAFALCGVVVARHRPGNPIGWLFLCFGIAHLSTAASVPVIAYGDAHDWPTGVLRALITVFALAWPFGIGLFLPLAVQLFPTGAPMSPRWRLLVWYTVVSGSAFVFWLGTGPSGVPLEGVQLTTYVEWTDQPAWVGLANVLVLTDYIAVIVSLVFRYVRGGDLVRRQLLWLVLAVIAIVVLNWPRWVFNDEGGILLLLAVPLIPLAVTIAIVRHQLFDIRLVVSRTVLYGLLTLGVAGAYAVLVAALDRVLRGAGAPVVATVLIALAFDPARRRLQRVVDRAFYGTRDPVQAVAAVGQRLAGDDLGGVLDAVREALRLPFAALRGTDAELAASGRPPAALHTVPLRFRGEHVGDLVVGVRTGERRLGGTDVAVLDLLATPLAVALHATRLSADLQESRERLVTATEEERRRLHRELHDSLGPALTGAAFKADAIGNLAATDPAHAGALSAELGTQIRAAIQDVRRLVYGLRPPALDELGLVGAVRRMADELDGDLTFDVEGRDLPPLSAAVEVAAYRIATEAMTNAVRHSRGRRAVLSLHADGQALHVSVTDDGAPEAAWRPGVGLRSIVERAAEVGGTAEAGPTPQGGRVTAVLPVGVRA